MRTPRPVLLDLYCKAGGAAMGYHRAGFDVVGVDLEPQPRYPFTFHQGDALKLGAELLRSGRFAAAHASPPCQRFTALQAASKNADVHPDLIEPTRGLMRSSGLPYVMENVPGAPLEDAVVLCGTSFGLQAGGFEVRRHRLFECSFFVMAMPCWHRLPAAPVYGHNAGRDFMRRHGRGFTIEEKIEAMGIDWMNRDELAQSIPPAFTEHIGGYLLAELAARAA